MAWSVLSLNAEIFLVGSCPKISGANIKLRKKNSIQAFKQKLEFLQFDMILVSKSTI